MFKELSKKHQAVGWFLFLSYAFGAPAMAVAEFQSQFLSERFGYAPEFIYLVKFCQFTCALLLLSRLAPGSIAVLTLLSLGAFASHLIIHAPLAALPALGYSVLQVWFGLHIYRRSR